MTSSRADILGRMMELQVEHRAGNVIVWTPGVLNDKKFCWAHNQQNMSGIARFLDDYVDTHGRAEDGSARPEWRDQFRLVGYSSCRDFPSGMQIALQQKGHAAEEGQGVQEPLGIPKR